MFFCHRAPATGVFAVGTRAIFLLATWKKVRARSTTEGRLGGDAFGGTRAPAARKKSILIRRAVARVGAIPDLSHCQICRHRSKSLQAGDHGLGSAISSPPPVFFGLTSVPLGALFFFE
ncbi:hypothetical protein TW95_gp1534 [Pandoravirus inopinatum]|uniref:Uncharacterized protein n=1 Tax=Pandoravirus inopinatum TaxID=1605721 RepID=A0A0B5IZF0_9VIRU|nr:hypothetical protein TW95_gp1534 [Pandoravirus inopinatum]AJF98268.1 hypothetical protein [Pandoravirus inopinatum]